MCDFIEAGGPFHPDACLIGAAPELLEALKIARDYSAYAHAEAGELSLIDAAIAEATGGTP